MIGSRTAAGVFKTGDRANQAANALREAGFAPEDISILSKYTRGAEDELEKVRGHAGDGVTVGAVAGGALGGLAGWLIGIGALTIPGIGPILAAGPLAVALGGLVAGGAAGGVTGALSRAGISDDAANWYATELVRGNWLVTVDAGGRHDEARRVLRQFGAEFAPSEAGEPSMEHQVPERREYAESEVTAAPDPGPGPQSGTRSMTPPGVSPTGGPP